MSEQAAAEQPELESERRDLSGENRLKRSIFDVPVNIAVSLGSLRKRVRDILELEAGAILPMGVGIEDPVELIVEGRVIAYGELKEIEDGGIAVVITEIATGDTDNEE